MTQSWVVTVGGRAYGPYTLEQMGGFIAEGRLAAGSLVAAPGDAAPYPAENDPVLGPLLFPAQRAVREPLMQAEPAGAAAPVPRFGRQNESGDSEPSHFLILADMKSQSIHGLEEAIYNLGQGQPLLPQAWLLTSSFSLNEIRNSLVQKLGTLDMLFVVDTRHDKAAWVNFGPEADVRIRRVWKKPDGARKSA